MNHHVAGEAATLRPGRIAGKVALVTGAGSGIGRAISVRLAKEGASLLITSKSADHLAEAYAEVEGLSDRPPLAVVADQAEASSASYLIGAAKQQFGRIDILSANAGIELIAEPEIEKIEDDDWEQVLAVNLSGTFRLCRAALGLMEAGSCIVTMGSVNSFRPRAGAAAYTASKGGLLQFTRALALEVAPRGIRANCVCPGNIDTPLTEAFLLSAPDYEEQRRNYAAESPMNRLGSPQEVADCVLFLASEEASFVTGTALIVDGGMSLT
jgi:NAD(P)-dependent dehydrogenase (short-subunit alcohol dehydrogenase family)